MEFQDLHVMVIEDEELLLEIISRKLNETGIAVTACRSGEEALQNLEADTKIPDVIWLDYHLKGMDGNDFILKIKGNPKFTNIPIVVVSNSANDQTVKKLTNSGAYKYMLKAENKLDDIIKTLKDVRDATKNK